MHRLCLTVSLLFVLLASDARAQVPGITYAAPTTYASPTPMYGYGAVGQVYAPPLYSAAQSAWSYAAPQMSNWAGNMAGGAVQGGGGGGGIVAQVNQLRASRGLGPVSWDGGLASEATRNSQIGFGHAYMGSARRQNSAISSSPSQAFGQWMNSPAHLSAMLDPSVTRIGLGNVGGTYTLNLR